MNVIEKIKENLSERQLEAVTTTEGYVRVIAGAGSGKTRALTSRYAYIVEALGINSSNILCVTFTNKAAQEMKKRVKRLIGDTCDVSLITTYHGFCVKVLREDSNKIQYPKNFIIMDVEDQKTILREIFKELDLSSKDFTFKQVIRNISQRKTSGDDLDYILKSQKYVPQNDQDRIFARYLEKQQRNFALDFDDLLNYALYIFYNNKDVLLKWQKRLHYIQVDETQDSSNKQFSLVEMLSDYHKNLFVVGDPDQTIYEWRGAKPELLVDFDKSFPDSQTIIMDQNYRSTPNILSLGNHIIKNNLIRVDKDMFTQNEQGVDVVHFHGEDDFEESLWIVNEIKELLKDNRSKLSDIAVLYRSHFISRNVEQALIRENIPYSVFGGIRFFERKEIKDTLAYMRLLAIGDDFSFLRVINTPSRGLGKKFLENLSKFAEISNQSLLKTLEENIDTSKMNRKGAIDFLNLVNKLRESAKTALISDLVKEILDESGLTNSYRTDGDTDRLDNIKEFQNSIIILENANGESFNLIDYLQEIALYTDMDLKNENDEKIKLMTIHTSKGLEFPYVFLCGFTEGVLPSAMSIQERRARAIEEERRLVYVAITRAEKGFYMTESEGYNFSTGYSKYPSRFLFEISEKLYVRKGELSQEIIDEAKENLRIENRENNAYQEFETDDIVHHPIWDLGRIVDVNTNKGEYIVEFFETKKTKPINFSFEHLVGVSENLLGTIYETRKEKSKMSELVKKIRQNDKLENELNNKNEIELKQKKIIELINVIKATLEKRSKDELQKRQEIELKEKYETELRKKIEAELKRDYEAKLRIKIEAELEEKRKSELKATINSKFKKTKEIELKNNEIQVLSTQKIRRATNKSKKKTLWSKIKNLLS